MTDWRGEFEKHRRDPDFDLYGFAREMVREVEQPTDWILEMLGSPDPDTWRFALAYLESLEYSAPSAIPAVLRAVDAPDSELRVGAVGVLGSLLGCEPPDAAAAYGRLIALAGADHEPHELRRAALRALVDLRLPGPELERAVAAAAGALIAEKPPLRHAAAAFLAKHGEHAGPVIPTLVAALDDGDADTRVQVAIALARSPLAVEEMVARLVRMCGMRGVCEAVSRRAGVARPLLAQAGRDDPETRIGALWGLSLAAVSHEDAPDVLGVVASTLADPEERFRHAAVRVLESFRPDLGAPHAPRVLEVLEGAERLDTVRACVRVLARLRHEPAIPVCAALLGTRHRDAKTADEPTDTVVAALPQFGAAAVPALIRAAADAKVAPHVLGALHVLGRADPTLALPGLRALLIGRGRLVKKAAMEVLAALRLEPQVFPELVALLFGRYDDLAATALHRLSQHTAEHAAVLGPMLGARRERRKRPIELLVERARLRRDVSDLAGARADLDRVLAQEPDQAGALADRGSLRRQMGDPQGAIADLDRALALEQEVAWYAWRAQAHAALGGHAAAIADCDRYLAVCPDAPITLGNRSLYRRYVGDVPGAFVDGERALALAPDDAYLHYNHACLCAVSGRTADALVHLERAIALAPSYRDGADADEDFAALRGDAGFQRLVTRR